MLANQCADDDYYNTNDCHLCVSGSCRPSVQNIIKRGTRVDKLYLGKFLPLREKKLVAKLRETRAEYDRAVEDWCDGVHSYQCPRDPRTKFSPDTPCSCDWSNCENLKELAECPMAKMFNEKYCKKKHHEKNLKKNQKKGQDKDQRKGQKGDQKKDQEVGQQKEQKKDHKEGQKKTETKGWTRDRKIQKDEHRPARLSGSQTENELSSKSSFINTEESRKKHKDKSTRLRNWDMENLGDFEYPSDYDITCDCPKRKYGMQRRSSAKLSPRNERLEKIEKKNKRIPKGKGLRIPSSKSVNTIPEHSPKFVQRSVSADVVKKAAIQKKRLKKIQTGERPQHKMRLHSGVSVSSQRMPDKRHLKKYRSIKSDTSFYEDEWSTTRPHLKQTRSKESQSLIPVRCRCTTSLNEKPSKVLRNRSVSSQSIMLMKKPRPLFEDIQEEQGDQVALSASEIQASKKAKARKKKKGLVRCMCNLKTHLISQDYKNESVQDMRRKHDIHTKSKQKIKHTQAGHAFEKCLCHLKSKAKTTRKRMSRTSMTSRPYRKESKIDRLSSKSEIIQTQLEANECEPGVCIPYECLPEQCLKLLKKRVEAENRLEMTKKNKKPTTKPTKKTNKTKKRSTSTLSSSSVSLLESKKAQSHTDHRKQKAAQQEFNRRNAEANSKKQNVQDIALQKHVTQGKEVPKQRLKKTGSNEKMKKKKVVESGTSSERPRASSRSSITHSSGKSSGAENVKKKIQAQNRKTKSTKQKEPRPPEKIRKGQKRIYRHVGEYTSRQSVNIGSSFSFGIEFSKGNACNNIRPYFKQEHELCGPKRLRCDEQNLHSNRENFPKRCFCTLDFHKDYDVTTKPHNMYTVNRILTNTNKMLFQSKIKCGLPDFPATSIYHAYPIEAGPNVSQLPLSLGCTKIKCEKKKSNRSLKRTHKNYYYERGFDVGIKESQHSSKRFIIHGHNMKFSKTCSCCANISKNKALYENQNICLHQKQYNKEKISKSEHFACISRKQKTRLTRSRDTHLQDKDLFSKSLKPSEYGPFIHHIEHKISVTKSGPDGRKFDASQNYIAVKDKNKRTPQYQISRSNFYITDWKKEHRTTKKADKCLKSNTHQATKDLKMLDTIVPCDVPKNKSHDFCHEKPYSGGKSVNRDKDKNKYVNTANIKKSDSLLKRCKDFLRFPKLKNTNNINKVASKKEIKHNFSSNVKLGGQVNFKQAVYKDAPIIGEHSYSNEKKKIVKIPPFLQEVIVARAAILEKNPSLRRHLQPLDAPKGDILTKDYVQSKKYANNNRDEIKTLFPYTPKKFFKHFSLTQFRQVETRVKSEKDQENGIKRRRSKYSRSRVVNFSNLFRNIIQVFQKTKSYHDTHNIEKNTKFAARCQSEIHADGASKFKRDPCEMLKFQNPYRINKLRYDTNRDKSKNKNKDTTCQYDNFHRNQTIYRKTLKPIKTERQSKHFKPDKSTSAKVTGAFDFSNYYNNSRSQKDYDHKQITLTPTDHFNLTNKAWVGNKTYFDNIKMKEKQKMLNTIRNKKSKCTTRGFGHLNYYNHHHSHAQKKLHMQTYLSSPTKPWEINKNTVSPSNQKKLMNNYALSSILKSTKSERQPKNIKENILIRKSKSFKDANTVRSPLYHEYLRLQAEYEFKKSVRMQAGYHKLDWAQYMGSEYDKDVHFQNKINTHQYGNNYQAPFMQEKVVHFALVDQPAAAEGIKIASEGDKVVTEGNIKAAGGNKKAPKEKKKAAIEKQVVKKAKKPDKKAPKNQIVDIKTAEEKVKDQNAPNNQPVDPKTAEAEAKKDAADKSCHGDCPDLVPVSNVYNPTSVLDDSLDPLPPSCLPSTKSDIIRMQHGLLAKQKDCDIKCLSKKPAFELRLLSDTMEVQNTDGLYEKVSKIHELKGKDMIKLQMLHGDTCCCCICTAAARAAAKEIKKRAMEEERRRKEDPMSKLPTDAKFKAWQKSIGGPCVCPSLKCRKEYADFVKNNYRPDALKKMPICTCKSKICEEERIITLLENREITEEMAELLLDELHARQLAAKRADYVKVLKENMRKQKHIQEINSPKRKHELRKIKREAKKSEDIFIIGETVYDAAKYLFFLPPRLYRFFKTTVMNRVVLGRTSKPLQKKSLLLGCDDVGIKHQYDKFIARMSETRLGKSFAINVVSRLYLDPKKKSRFKQQKLELEKVENKTEAGKAIAEAKSAAIHRNRRGGSKKQKISECNLFMSTLRKKECLWVYYQCAWFYPHFLNALKIFRSIRHLFFILLAVIVWSPCLLLMETCRAVMCCTLCTS